MIEHDLKKVYSSLLELRGKTECSFKQEPTSEPITNSIFDSYTFKSKQATTDSSMILQITDDNLNNLFHDFDLHANEYLTKPLESKELVIGIEDLIKNSIPFSYDNFHKRNNEQIELQKEISTQKIPSLTTKNEYKKALNDKFLLQLEEIVSEMYMESHLNIHSLARKMLLSERQIQRKIKAGLGTTPHNYVKTFRLIKALELLKKDLQIGRVALDVGFSSQTYFGKCFKACFNCTPKQYQQNNTLISY